MNRQPLRCAALGALTLAAALAHGCGTHAAAPAPLRLGLLVWPPYELFVIAEQLGAYDDAALQLVDFQTPADLIRAYQNETVDIVAMTGDFFLQVQSIEPEHQVVLLIDYSTGGDAVVGRAGVEVAADLRGKRVGVERSVLGQLMLTRMLEHAGLTLDDVEVVYLDMPEHAEAFGTGAIDAVVTYEPMSAQMLALGGHLLFDSTQLSVEVADVLFTRRKHVAARAADLQALIDGYFVALDYLRAEPRAAAALCVERHGVDIDTFLASFEQVHVPDRAENAALLSGAASGDLPSLRESLERSLPVLVAIGAVPADFELADGGIDPRFVLESGGE